MAASPSAIYRQSLVYGSLGYADRLVLECNQEPRKGGCGDHRRSGRSAQATNYRLVFDDHSPFLALAIAAHSHAERVTDCASLYTHALSAINIWMWTCDGEIFVSPISTLSKWKSSHGRFNGHMCDSRCITAALQLSFPIYLPCGSMSVRCRTAKALFLAREWTTTLRGIHTWRIKIEFRRRPVNIQFLRAFPVCLIHRLLVTN
ncbi:hypothetical protein B0G74_1908 [Paraburkholderia sp. BL9I2N2]|jgi:hypothetical protein|nr:hypothetical protein B0G74_1908 [Paraburkholderia sp. BL9I2N2]